MTTANDVGVVPEWTIGDRLRKARLRLGLGQREMAELVGVTQKTIWAAESGTTNPSRLLVRSWAMASGVDPVWLATGTAAQTPPPAGLPAGGVGEAQCAIRDSNPEPADLESALLAA